MKLRVLALDYDGTIAQDGRLDPAVSSACAGPATTAWSLDARQGASVVVLPADAVHAVIDVVRRLELPLVCLFNRERLMVLPQAVSKATGLREAVRALRLGVADRVGLARRVARLEPLLCIKG